MRYILFILLLTTLLSCRKEERVSYVSPFYYYSEDDTKILYDMKEIDGISYIFRKGNYKEVTTDVNNFSTIGRHFGKDANMVYYKYTPIENVDPESFSIQHPLFLPMDKNHLYYPEPIANTNTLRIIEYADPETYEKVPFHDCLKWFRDKNYYFYNHQKVNADRETMSFEANYLPFDNQYIFPVENGTVHPIRYNGRITVFGDHLIRDSLNYYFNAGCDSIIRIIKFNDPAQFEYYERVEDHIFRIDNSIYIKGLLFLAKIVDVATFKFIGESYSKDKQHVYYKDKLIPDADPETFEIISSQYAKDKNHIYEAGKILPDYSPDHFEEDAWGRFPPDKEYGKAPRSSRSSSSWSWDDDD